MWVYFSKAYTRKSKAEHKQLKWLHLRRTCTQLNPAQPWGAIFWPPALLCLRDGMGHNEGKTTWQQDNKSYRVLWAFTVPLSSSWLWLMLCWDVISLHGNQNLPLCQSPESWHRWLCCRTGAIARDGNKRYSLPIFSAFPSSIYWKNKLLKWEF